MSESISRPAAMPPPARWLAMGLIAGVILLGAGLYFYASQAITTAGASQIPGDARIQAFYLPGESAPTEDQFARVLAERDKFVPMTSTDLAKVMNRRLGEARWYCLEISNPTDKPVYGVLDMIWRIYDRTALYEPTVEGGWKTTLNGGGVPREDALRSPRHRAFHLDLGPRETKTVYLRVQDNFRLPTQFSFWFNYQDFLRQEHLTTARNFAYLFLWAGMVAYGLFLYAMVRERAQLHYVLFISLLGGVFLISNGLTTYLFPWPNWPLAELLGSLFAILALVNLCLFARYFLDTARHDPVSDLWIHRLQRVIWAWTLTFPVLLFPTLGLLYLQLIATLGTTVVGVLLWASIRSWKRGCRYSPFFVLAFSPYFLALILWAIFSQDKVVSDDRQRLATLIGNGLSLIFLSFAAAYRHRVALDENYRLQATYTARLEKEVDERTSELRELSNRLAKTVADRDRIMAIIGHDLRGPAISLKSLAYLMTQDTGELSNQELTELSSEIETLCTHQLELLNNLLIWGGAQSGSWKMKTDEIPLRRESAQVCSLLSELAQAKSLSILNHIPPELCVASDEQFVQTVLRNFLANAIKYSHPGGRIELNARLCDGEWVEISVRDQGVGMPPERLAALFQESIKSAPGTGSERGAGIGLSLCQDLTEVAGGRLWMESELGKGTTAFLKLAASLPQSSSVALQA